MHSNTIGTLIMNAINMQEIENIAELLWEAIYSGNNYLPLTTKNPSKIEGFFYTILIFYIGEIVGDCCACGPDGNC